MPGSQVLFWCRAAGVAHAVHRPHHAAAGGARDPGLDPQQVAPGWRPGTSSWGLKASPIPWTPPSTVCWSTGGASPGHPCLCLPLEWNRLINLVFPDPELSELSGPPVDPGAGGTSGSEFVLTGLGKEASACRRWSAP